MKTQGIVITPKVCQQRRGTKSAFYLLIYTEPSSKGLKHLENSRDTFVYEDYVGMRVMHVATHFFSSPQFSSLSLQLAAPALPSPALPDIFEEVFDDKEDIFEDILDDKKDIFVEVFDDEEVSNDETYIFEEVLDDEEDIFEKVFTDENFPPRLQRTCSKQRSQQEGGKI